MIDDAVYYIATQASGLTALIGSGNNTRLAPAGGPKSSNTLPRVEYVKEPPRPVSGIWHDSGWFHTVFDFLVLAPTAREAGLVVEQLRAAYARYHSNGANVGSSGHKIDDAETVDADESADYDADLGCYTQGIGFEFFHN